MIKARFYGVRSPSRSQLVGDSLDGGKIPIPCFVNMPCGWTYTIEDSEDWPATDLPCRCGDPEHVVVGYITQPAQVRGN
jgi:hypothetical protein